jgi:hypothetical protein
MPPLLLKFNNETWKCKVKKTRGARGPGLHACVRATLLASRNSLEAGGRYAYDHHSSKKEEERSCPKRYLISKRLLKDLLR